MIRWTVPKNEFHKEIQGWYRPKEYYLDVLEWRKEFKGRCGSFILEEAFLKELEYGT